MTSGSDTNGERGWLVAQSRSFLGWLVSVYRKILRTAPLEILAVVVLTIVSQVSRLAAFFLPLKIVILIGSSGIPRYFPGSLQALERESLVAVLGLATVAAYLLHLLCERLVTRYVERSADKLIARGNKLVLVANQNDVGRLAYRRLAEMLAALVFAGLATGLIAYIHPAIAIFICVWTLGAALFVLVAGRTSARFRVWIEENGGPFASNLASTGFLAATAVIILEFIVGASFHVLLAIVSLMMSREILQKLSRVVGNALALYPQRPLINALFYSGHTWSVAETPSRKDGWEWVTRDRPEQWLPALIAEGTGEAVRHAEMTRWHQTGLADELVMDVRAETLSGEVRTFLFKLFTPRRAVWAASEVTLLGGDSAHRLPAPDLLASGRMEGFDWLLYAPLEGKPVVGAEKTRVMVQMRAACLAYAPPKELAVRYARSHQLLGKRLLAARVERLKAVCAPQHAASLDRFAEGLGALSAFVSALPVAVHNPDLIGDPCVIGAGGEPVLAHWFRWTLEPVGGGWPANAKDLAALNTALDAAKASRPELASVTPDAARLSAQLFAFDKFLVAQRYHSAIAMLPDILKSAERAGAIEAPQPAPLVAPVALAAPAE